MAALHARPALAGPAENARGLAWLQSQVQPDGGLAGVGAGGALQLARCETAVTLLKLAGPGPQPDALLAALQADVSAQATQIAACAQLLRQRQGETVLSSEVEQRRIPSAGYGAYAGFQAASELDSGWALQAQLRNLPLAERTQVLGWLQARQAADGSFGVAGRPDLLATAAVLRGISEEIPSQPTAAAIAAKAAAWLLSRRDAQAQWADDVDTTAAVFEAVHPFTGADPSVAAGVEAFLLARQRADGSWNADAHGTALALRALALVPVPALDPTRAGLKVRFVDARSALPVPAVQLVSATPQISVASGADGTISLSGLAAGAYQFSASAAGYATVNIAVSLQTGQVLDLGTLQLVAPASATTAVVSGTVRDQAAGTPLAGVSVVVEGQGLSAATGADGSYLISGVVPGNVSVTASKAGYFTAAGSAQARAGQVLNFSPLLAADPGNSTTVDCRIVGTVLDATTQQPLPGVAITLSGANTGSVLTDAAGRYATANLVGGLTSIVASKSGYDPVSASTQIVCSTARSTATNFSPRLYPATQTPPNANTAGLKGAVVDAATNLPIGGAQLVLTPYSGAPRALTAGGVGQFIFEGLDGPSAQLQVQASGYEGITVTYSLSPLETVDIGQIRLRRPKVDQLAPDLRVLQVLRASARTDAQTLVLSGAVEAVVSNAGTESSPAGIGLTAFFDADRNNRFDAATDPVLGRAVLPASLAPAATTTVSITVSGTLAFRDAPIHVVVDGEGMVAEKDETNNVNSTAAGALLQPQALAFNPKLKWQWTSSTAFPGYNQVMMAPVVGRLLDTNGDGAIDARDVPVVVFTTFPGGSYGSPGIVRVLHGATGQELMTINGNVDGIGGIGGLALADLDRDGKPEIIGVTTDYKVIVLRNDGTRLWKSAAAFSGGSPWNVWAAPAVADLDGDGSPEILVGRSVYNADGTLKWRGTGSYAGTQFGLEGLSLPIAADLFGTGKQNVILGGSVYSHDGTLLWQRMDGYAAVADFEGNGEPSIAVTGNGQLALYSRTGVEKWRVTIPGGSNGGGAPTIADADRDGKPDIGVAGALAYTVFRGDGSVIWSMASQDNSSRITGSTFFDFDGDGTAEVLYADEVRMRAFRGTNGQTLWSIPNPSGTAVEYPLVVDTDADSRADFVVVGNNYAFAGFTGVRVYQDQNNEWVGVRSLWNQHAYSIDNINDDLTVPRVPAQSWKTHNTFRLNKRVDGDPRAVPDLTVGYLRVADSGPSGSMLTVRVGNTGSYAVPAATRLAVYSTDPALGTPAASALVGTATVGAELQPGQWVDVNLAVNRDLASLNALGQIWVVGDDDGTGKRTLQDFDRSNNTHRGNLPLVAANLLPTVSTDKPIYTEAEIAQFTTAIRNGGSFTQSTAVRYTVLDAEGQVVEVLPLSAVVTVGAGGTVNVVAPWPVAGILAGGYTLKAELISPAGLVYGVATTTFAVTASQQQAGLARITADRASYSAAQTVQLSSRVSNATSNTPLQGVVARTEVFNAANAGVFVREEPIEQLAAGGSRQYGYSLAASGLGAGSYQARLQLVGGNGSVLAQSTTAFSVLGADQTGVGLVGSLQANPGTVFIGQVSQLSLVATNNAAQSLGNVPVTVRVVDPDSGAVLASFEATVASWAAGQTQNLQFAWTGAGSHGQTVVAVASAQVGGKDVPLGQANIKVLGILYTGTIAAEPREVEAGSDVALAYSVSNPAPVNGRMAGSVAVQTAGGQSVASWPLDLSIGAQASYAGNQLYTTGEQQQTLTAVLSQQLGTGSVVLATTTFTIVDPPVPVGLQTVSQAPGRVLVLVSCPPGLGAQEEAACVAMRSQAIQTYLGSLGYASKAVSTEQAFLSELRCGAWSTYWISGGAIKLSAASVGELKEAIRRGEALWMDGVHDSRNQLLHEVAGVKEIGKLAARDQVASLSEGGLYGAQGLPTQGQPTRFELAGGQAQGVFAGGVPAIVSNNWGQGRSLVFAFDLAGMVTADANAASSQLAGVVSASVSHAQGGTPTLTVGDITQLVASVTNQGTRTVSFKAEATLPAGLASVVTVPQAQLTPHSDGSVLATWSFTLEGGKTQQLVWQVKASAAGSYSVPLSVYSLPRAGSTAAPKLRASGAFSVQVQEGAALVSQVPVAIGALQPTLSADKQDKVKAAGAVSQAQSLHGQGQYEAAIAQWLAAAEALGRITSADTTEAKRAVALALEATTDALCIQRCGSAGCQ